jgi:hypothetical protein
MKIKVSQLAKKCFSLSLFFLTCIFFPLQCNYHVHKSPSEAANLSQMHPIRTLLNTRTSKRQVILNNLLQFEAQCNILHSVQLLSNALW